MGNFEHAFVALAALAASCLIDAPARAQETTGPDSVTGTEAETETETETDSETETETETETVTETDSDSETVTVTVTVTETETDSDSDSGALGTVPEPGEPPWMTPQLRQALDDPETAEEIRDYFHQPTLEWDESWSRFGWADASVMIGLAVAGVIGQLVPEADTPRWTGGILFDDDVRRAMVLNTYDERENVATTSDNLLALLLLYPYLVDGVIMSLLIHEAPEAAAEMMLVDTLAYAITFAVVNVTKKAVARERPFVQECAGDPSYANGCNPDDHGRNSSFISGHSAFSFTAAGVMCAHHINLPIHGDVVADYAVCGSGLLAATTVAAMRISADRHYFTDVFAGAAVGLLAGWLMPTLLRYQNWNPLPETEHVKMVPVPQMGPNQLGLGVAGIF